MNNKKQKAFKKLFTLINQIHQNNKDLDPEELEAMIDEAVKDVRAKTKEKALQATNNIIEQKDIV